MPAYGKTVKALRNHRRGLSDDLIATATGDEASKSPKIRIEKEPLAPSNKVSIDYPRPLRISSNDGTVEEVRSALRYNAVAHNDFNPILDSLKTRLLLKGVYQPN